jgi:hypothetical protein
MRLEHNSYTGTSPGPWLLQRNICAGGCVTIGVGPAIGHVPAEA